MKATRAIATSLLTFASSLVQWVRADTIHIGMINQCTGVGGDIKVQSANCENCNFGEKATLSGAAACSTSYGTSTVEMKATAHALGQEHELFRQDFTCGSTFESDFDIPHLTPFLETVAAASIKVEFYDGEDRVGCSEIHVNSTPVMGAKIAGGVAVAGLAGFAIYKFLGGSMGAAAGSGMAGRTTDGSSDSNFSRMDDKGAVV